LALCTSQEEALPGVCAGQISNADLVSPDRQIRGIFMSELRFDVYGREIVVESKSNGWKAYLVGGDGKRRAADFPIPAELHAEEILRYLDDLFHESATVAHPEVRRI
jgi:hypothetical protein